VSLRSEECIWVLHKIWTRKLHVEETGNVCCKSAA